MTNYQANVTLVINGQLITVWETITIQRAIKEISTLECLIPNRFGRVTNEFSKNQSVQLFATWGKGVLPFWTGVIDKITRIANRWGQIKIWCRDPLRIYERERTVDNNFQPYPNFIGTYLNMMIFMNSQISIPIQINTEISPNDFSIQKEFVFRTTLEEFAEAANISGYEWYFSGVLSSIIIKPPTARIATNVKRDFILGDPALHPSANLTNFGFLISNSVEEDFADEYTRVRADGPDGSGISAVFPSTVPSDIREQYLQNDDWITPEACLQAATNFYNDNHNGRISVDIGLLHGQEDIEVGDIIYCDDVFYGLSRILNKYFRVIQITDTFSKAGWQSKFKLGDFSPTLVDFL